MLLFDTLTSNLYDGGPSFTHEVVTSQEPELEQVLEILNQIYNISRNKYPRIRLIFLRLPKEANLDDIQALVDEAYTIISQKPQKYSLIAELICKLDVEINKDFGVIDDEPKLTNDIYVMEIYTQSQTPDLESFTPLTFSLERATNEAVQRIKSELRQYLPIDNPTAPWFFQNGMRDIISIEVNSYQDLLMLEEAISKFRDTVYTQKYNAEISYLLPILGNTLVILASATKTEKIRNHNYLSTPKA